MRAEGRKVGGGGGGGGPRGSSTPPLVTLEVSTVRGVRYALCVVASLYTGEGGTYRLTTRWGVDGVMEALPLLAA